MGSYDFDDLRQLLLVGFGDPTYRLPESVTFRDLRSWLLAFFAQDDFRVTPNLTLNLGLRWEFTTGMNEANGQVSYLAKGPILSTADDLILGKLWENHIKNFEPRIGFNWAFGQEQMTSLSGCGFSYRADRPNLNPGVDINEITSGTSAGCVVAGGDDILPGTPVGNRSLYFDPCVFSAPPRGTIGNAARNLIIGPDLRNVNFTLSKSFQFGESARLQFRSEFFNLFNRVQLRNPAARVFTSLTDGVRSNAGLITESLDGSARQIQLGLKLTF